MKQTFSHTLLGSFYLWYDHYLLTTGQAFYTTTGRFYEDFSDPSLPGAITPYNATVRQLVYDSSVPGAIIMSGIYDGGLFTSNNSGGLTIDYQFGRALTTGSFISPSGAYSYKEFNTYITSEVNQELIFEQIMNNDTSVGSLPTGLAVNKFVAPCSIISLNQGDNVPFSFGGEDLSEISANVFLIAKDQYQIDGMLSLLRDTNNLMFPLIQPNLMPLDYYGNIKSNLSGVYNYNSYVQTYGVLQNSNLAWIKKVHTSKISEKVNNINNYFIAFAEFELVKQRYSRLTQ